jgi:hypothetical protein
LQAGSGYLNISFFDDWGKSDGGVCFEGEGLRAEVVFIRCAGDNEVTTTTTTTTRNYYSMGVVKVRVRAIKE